MELIDRYFKEDLMAALTSNGPGMNTKSALAKLKANSGLVSFLLK